MPNKKKTPLSIQAAILTIVGGGIFVVLGSILTPFVQHYLESPKAPPLSEEAQAEQLYEDAQKWSIILFDTFSNNNSNWDEEQSTSEFVETKQFVDSGTYNWWVKANTYGGLRMTIAPAIASQKIYAAVDGKVLNYTNAVAYGLAFRCQGSDQYYHIRVYLEKNAVAIKYRDKTTDTWETLLYLPNVKIEEKEWNRIAVIAIGSDYWFYLDGQFIYHMQDDRLSGGRVGLIAAVEKTGDEANIAFDNFEYRSSP